MTTARPSDKASPLPEEWRHAYVRALTGFSSARSGALAAPRSSSRLSRSFQAVFITEIECLVFLSPRHRGLRTAFDRIAFETECDPQFVGAFLPRELGLGQALGVMLRQIVGVMVRLPLTIVVLPWVAWEFRDV